MGVGALIQIVQHMLVTGAFAGEGHTPYGHLSARNVDAVDLADTFHPLGQALLDGVDALLVAVILLQFVHIGEIGHHELVVIVTQVAGGQGRLGTELAGIAQRLLHGGGHRGDIPFHAVGVPPVGRIGVAHLHIALVLDHGHPLHGAEAAVVALSGDLLERVTGDHDDVRLPFRIIFAHHGETGAGERLLGRLDTGGNAGRLERAQHEGFQLLGPYLTGQQHEPHARSKDLFQHCKSPELCDEIS